MKKHTSLLKIILIFSLVHMLIVQWPLVTQVLLMVDVTHLNGAYALFVIEAIQFFLFAFVLGAIAIVSANLMRVVAGIILIVDVIALYFMTGFGVILNQEMIANILNTDGGEVSALIDWKIFAWGIILGVIPAAFLFAIKIKPHPYWHRLLIAPLALGVLALILTVSPNTSKWIDKNGLELGGRILPWSYVANMVRYFDEDHERYMRAQEILPNPTGPAADPGLVVLVIGESARADNFAWYDYARDTNPLTRAAGFRALPASDACATATIGSVACLLSRRGRQERIGLPEEPLPSYLTRQGVKTIVHVNNTGLPRIRVDDFLVGSQLKQICNADFCAERFEYTCSSGMCDDIFPDGILLSGVEDIAQAALSQPTFLLLHMGGSHGPNYFQKYPKRFNTFDPVCTNKYLPMCDQEGLRNAYDNTLIYTDAVLAELASILTEIEGLNATILYTSDHGQSLGEDGVYAHAAPLSSAPKYQLSIPFFIWQSDGAKREITNSSVAAHDAIFHTILGQFGFINGGVYRADRDLFAPESK